MHNSEMTHVHYFTGKEHPSCHRVIKKIQFSSVLTNCISQELAALRHSRDEITSWAKERKEVSGMVSWYKVRNKVDLQQRLHCT